MAVEKDMKVLDQEVEVIFMLEMVVQPLDNQLQVIMVVVEVVEVQAIL